MSAPTPAPTTASSPSSRSLPIAAFVWFGLALLLFILGYFPFALKDRSWDVDVATLVPNLWLPTLGFSSSTVLDIGALDTGLSLLFFVLAVAVAELALVYFYGRREGDLVRPLFRAVAIFLTFWSVFGHLPLWDVFLSALFPNSPNILYPRGSVVQLAGEHLELVLVSSLVTVSAGLLIGITVTRAAYREFLPLVSDFVSAGQTLPTLAIVAIMVPILGLGFWPAIVALIAYGMLPVVRNTVAGLEAVDSFMIDSARGMGMTPRQVLWQIELPSASNIIFAGYPYERRSQYRYGGSGRVRRVGGSGRADSRGSQPEHRALCALRRASGGAAGDCSRLSAGPFRLRPDPEGATDGGVGFGTSPAALRHDWLL